MPEFLENPSVLTKEKLKSQLVANNVRLPAGEQPKRVYVQLYLEHLTPLNRAKNRSPDFSSDEEREATPLPSSTNPSGRNRPGRKATKKTDKPRPEENIDPDVAKLSNEDLKEQLLNYGLNPGPILASTRKVYEKKLAKLIEQGSEVVSSTPLPTVSSTEDDTRQNGNTDSEYSDNEEEPRISLRLEKREPLKSKLKTPVTTHRQQRVEQNEIIDADVIPELNIKRSNRSPPKAFTQDEPVWNYTDPTSTEVDWTSGFSEHGPLQTVTRESARVSSLASRKRMGTAEQLPFDEAVISESTPIAETMSSSNQTLAHSEYDQFESQQVINKVPGNFKPTAPVLSINEFSDMSGRAQKKTLKDEVVRNTVIEERRTDILKEMFPYEVSTPTGISASCRRPIRGAAGRPVELSGYRTEESFSSRFVPKYASLADVKPEKAKKGHSVSIWIKILLFIVVAIFLFLVYQAMETNQGNPFAPYLGTPGGSKMVNN